MTEQERIAVIAGQINAAADLVNDIDGKGDLFTGERATLMAALDGGAWLLEQLREAQKDSKRLDGILARDISFGTVSDLSADPDIIIGAEFTAKLYPDKIFARFECNVQAYFYHCFDGKIPRDAIDAALAAPLCVERPDGSCVRYPPEDQAQRDYDATHSQSDVETPATSDVI